MSISSGLGLGEGWGEEEPSSGTETQIAADWLYEFGEVTFALGKHLTSLARILLSERHARVCPLLACIRASFTVGFSGPFPKAEGEKPCQHSPLLTLSIKDG